jgi:hypothetical protein
VAKLFGSLLCLAGIFIFLNGEPLGGALLGLLGVLLLVVGFRQPKKKCQFCAMDIPVAATVCPHCQRDLAGKSA